MKGLGNLTHLSQLQELESPAERGRTSWGQEELLSRTGRAVREKGVCPVGIWVHTPSAGPAHGPLAMSLPRATPALSQTQPGPGGSSLTWLAKCEDLPALEVMNSMNLLPSVGLKHPVFSMSAMRSNLAPKPLQGKGLAKVAVHIAQR